MGQPGRTGWPVTPAPPAHLFTPTERDDLFDRLVARARADPAVSAAAVVGSVARGEADRWSDIDLALRVAAGADPDAVTADWTAWLGETVPVADTLDVWAGSTRYRVFLTTGSLQVDLSFWPYDRFTATGPSFRLLFGEAVEPAPRSEPDRHELVGYAWLYAIHVRSAAVRGRPWQAEYMLGEMRHRLVALATLREGLDHREWRGADGLPAAWLARLAGTRPVALDAGSQFASLAAAIELVRDEAQALDPDLARRLAGPLSLLVPTGED